MRDIYIHRTLDITLIAIKQFTLFSKMFQRLKFKSLQLVLHAHIVKFLFSSRNKNSFGYTCNDHSECGIGLATYSTIVFRLRHVNNTIATSK